MMWAEVWNHLEEDWTWRFLEPSSICHLFSCLLLAQAVLVPLRAFVELRSFRSVATFKHKTCKVTYILKSNYVTNQGGFIQLIRTCSFKSSFASFNRPAVETKLYITNTINTRVGITIPGDVM